MQGTKSDETSIESAEISGEVCPQPLLCHATHKRTPVTHKNAIGMCVGVIHEKLQIRYDFSGSKRDFFGILCPRFDAVFLKVW